MITNHLGTCCEDEHGPGARPSVESHLHALLGRCVIHLHPLAVGAYVCAKDGRTHLEKMLAKADLPWLWIPYTAPGYQLAAAVRRLVMKYEAEHGHLPTLLFLEKHGLFATADSPAAALKATHRAVDLCAASLPKPRPTRPLRRKPDETRAFSFAIRKALKEVTGEHFLVRLFTDDPVAGFLAAPTRSNSPPGPR